MEGTDLAPQETVDRFTLDSCLEKNKPRTFSFQTQSGVLNRQDHRSAPDSPRATPQCRHFHPHEVMTATFSLVTTLFYQDYKMRHTLDFAQRQEGLLLQEVVNLGHRVSPELRAASALPFAACCWWLTAQQLVSKPTQTPWPAPALDLPPHSTAPHPDRTSCSVIQESEHTKTTSLLNLLETKTFVCL